LQAERGADRITRDIIEKAEKEGAETIQAAREKAEVMLNAARLSAREESEKQKDEIEVLAGHLREEILAKGRMAAKRELLEKREELIFRILERAKKESHAFTNSKKYKDVLLKIAVDACEKVGSRAVVLKANRRDLDFLKRSKREMERRLKGRRISFGRSIETIGGIRARSEDGAVEVDETFEGRLNRQLESLRIEVAKLLFEG
jgi:vacuolar-type H+-ATPase subunit E/Vma4